MPSISKCGDQLFEADRFRDRYNVTARHGDIANRSFPEMKEIAQHLALNARQIAFAVRFTIFFGFIDRILNLIAERRFSVTEEQGPKTRPYSAATAILWHGGAFQSP
jgi:hypothetical protein